MRLNHNSAITQSSLIRRLKWLQPSTEVVRRIISSRRLTVELAKRELLDRYAGQMAGAAWALLHPLLTLVVYLFLFSAILRLKIPAVGNSSGDFTIYLLAGLLPWLALQDVAGRAATLIVSQAHLVKQVAFPLEVLPVKAIPPAFVLLIIGIFVLGAYTLFNTSGVPWTYLLLPLPVGLLFMLCAGIALGLSALGVFVRDAKDIVQLLVFVGLYVSPVFYTLEAVPSILRPAVLANPFSYMILVFQDCLYYGAIMHPGSWLIYVAASFGAFIFGSWMFVTTRPFFGSYL
jgi:lipopolysaccharide transport system permease protein